MPPRHPGHNPELLVDAWADSLDAAVRQIGKRPRLTAWAWHSTWDAYLGPTVPYPEQPTSMWLPGQEQALFDQVQRAARARGQTVRRR